MEKNHDCGCYFTFSAVSLPGSENLISRHPDVLEIEFSRDLHNKIAIISGSFALILNEDRQMVFSIDNVRGGWASSLKYGDIINIGAR